MKYKIKGNLQFTIPANNVIINKVVSKKSMKIDRTYLLNIIL